MDDTPDYNRPEITAALFIAATGGFFLASVLFASIYLLMPGDGVGMCVLSCQAHASISTCNQLLGV
jgi:hypothetical protein